MKLSKLAYSEFDGLPNEWKLNETLLGKKNLIVGKNATGKSRFLSVISALSNLFSGDLKTIFTIGNYVAEFTKGNDIHRYELSLENNIVTFEKLIKNGEPQFERDQTGIGSIFALDVGEHIKFQIPANKIVVQAKRDQIQHPFLEDLIEWGRNVRFLQFGTSLGKENGIFLGVSLENIPEPKNTLQPAVMFQVGKTKFNNEFIQNIQADMNSIGYQIESIDIGINPAMASMGTNLVGLLCVKERDRQSLTYQNEMSQGMFRALSTIIQLNYQIYTETESSILIDDIGEGIDYDRSVKLIELVMSDRLGAKNQVLISSNDKFVMNTVPIEHWQIMQRSGSKCSFINRFNSKNIFDDFVDVGLSNFDFFSNEFYMKGFEEE